MIKAIIFDYLGVLVHGFENFYTKLSEFSNKREMEIKEIFSKHWQPLKIGKITDDKFWKEMKKDLKIEDKEINYLKKYMTNLLKPDKKIYLHVLKEIKLLPEEVIFIDDSEKNLIVAKEMGFNTIEFKKWYKS